LNGWRALGWPVATGLMAALLILQTLHYRELAGRPAAVAEDAGAPVSYAAAVRRATPAVVNIYTRKVIRRPYNPLFDEPFFQRLFKRGTAPQRERIQRSLGSGVIMSADGYLLTNNHVIAGASEILVLLADGREAIATVIGTDPDTDLAVLDIDLPELQPIPVGDPDAAEVGDVVLAIGNPYGFGQSVSQGIISATGRFGLQLNTYENFIQTDAAINPGNSGGALLDARGNLLGINTAIYSPSGGSQGIGLAIPADYAIKVLRDIVAHGYVVRGWLGVEVQPLPARIVTADGAHTGLVVSDVEPGSPAQTAGVLPGDILLALNGTATSQGRNAMYRIALMAPGEAFDLEIYRDEQLVRLAGKLGQRPQD
jgi:serine protease DegS